MERELPNNTQQIGPVSCVVATSGRPGLLARTLESVFSQSLIPFELVVIDSSKDHSTFGVVDGIRDKVKKCDFKWQYSNKSGAAFQRNVGVQLAQQEFVWFLDDDVILEPGCLMNLFNGIKGRHSLGAVNAMITNQSYTEPGFVSRSVFRCFSAKCTSYAGRVIGPAISFLPEDKDKLPEIVETEWLNTTCTLYRRCALPEPPFDNHFEGYSLMEDLALSLRVGKTWKLANVRSARLYHDSQPAAYKSNLTEMAAMELVNRHYIMMHIMGRSRKRDLLNLALWECFLTASLLPNPRRFNVFLQTLVGKLRGCTQIRAKAK